MFVDALHLFSDAQALAASAVSTNVIPLAPIHSGNERRIGTGEPMAVLITVDVAPDETTGDETYSAQLESDTTDAFGSATSVGGAIAIPRTANAGDQFVGVIPPYAATENFLRLSYTLGGTTPSVTVTAQLIPLSMIPANALVYYVDNITIS